MSYGLPIGAPPEHADSLRYAAMKDIGTPSERTILKLASFLTLMFATIHMSQDTILQAVGEVRYPIPVAVFVVWLYATLLLADRLAGHIIMLLGGFIGAGMIMLHGIGTIVDKKDGLFFVWVLFAMATTGWFTMVLAARAMRAGYRARRSGA